MRKFVRLGSGVVVLLLILWLGTAGLVWSRNRVPALALPAPEAMPSGNVYEEYVRCITALKPEDKRDSTNFVTNGSLPPAARQAALDRNRELLARFHGLVGKPCMVTKLEPGADFLPAQEFPMLTGLVLIESDAAREKESAKALDTFLDALTYGEDVMRGGATLHLDTTLMTLAPAALYAPKLLPSLSASDCVKGAERMRALLQAQYPLPKLMGNERLIRVKRLVAILEPLSGKIFKFQIPTESYDWQYLTRPKTAAVEELDRYLSEWTKEAEKPVRDIQPPSEPKGLEGILSDESLSPESYGMHLFRYRYKEARLRLIYTALRLEQVRKTKGQYPASLSALGNDPDLLDPFSGKPLVYRPSGAKFTLYSVGFNGKDDGNRPEPPGRAMSPGRPSDIAFEPQYIGRLTREKKTND